MKLKDKIITLITIIIVIVITLFCNSCKTIKEVPIEKIEYKTEYRDRILLDSIYQHDSIYIQQKGDTIWKYRDKYIYRNRYLHDTIFFSKIDTIPQIIEVPMELSRYDKLKCNVGGFMIPIIFILIFIVICWIIKKII